MGTEAEGSVTGWIGDLKNGQPDAAGRLWQRYFAGPVRPGRKKLEAVPRAAAVEDEEDAALSAFHSLCAGAAAGQVRPPQGFRDDLWRLLVVVTVCKVLRSDSCASGTKRGGGRVVARGGAGWIVTPTVPGVRAIHRP